MLMPQFMIEYHEQHFSPSFQPKPDSFARLAPVSFTSYTFSGRAQVLPCAVERVRCGRYLYPFLMAETNAQPHVVQAQVVQACIGALVRCRCHLKSFEAPCTKHLLYEYFRPKLPCFIISFAHVWNDHVCRFPVL